MRSGGRRQNEKVLRCIVALPTDIHLNTEVKVDEVQIGHRFHYMSGLTATDIAAAEKVGLS